jgi:pyruvate/2-oxoglutarate dehydrogenase complex dihydrolipoamide acyltransferase (E2) component
MKVVASTLNPVLCAIAILVLAACDRSVGAASGAAADAPSTQPPATQPAQTAATPAKKQSTPAVPDRPPSDREITVDAAKAMRGDPALAGSDLSVTTQHGVVSLTGTVRSPEQVAVAEARAQSPSGVMRVETHLAVDPER